MPRPIHFVTDLDPMLAQVTAAGGAVALGKMPIPTVGWPPTAPTPEATCSS